MFDISFTELMIISIVALIVVGPERLPLVARTLGHFLGRAKRYVERIKHDLHEEIELENLRKLKDSMQDTVNTFEESIQEEIGQVRKSIDPESKLTEKDSPAIKLEQEETTPNDHDRSINSQSKTHHLNTDSPSSNQSDKS